jgi:nucleoside 2-deoxyribosyltransferase
MKSVYIIGSLRNQEVPVLAEYLRARNFDAFDSWYSAGPRADDHWQEHEEFMGHDFVQALDGYAARNVFAFDKRNLDRCDAAVLVLPAGKSGHLELGYFIGTGKPGFILLDGEPDRFDVMYRFATQVCRDTDELVEALWKV